MNKSCQTCVRWNPLPVNLTDGRKGYGYCGQPEIGDYGEGTAVIEIVLVATAKDHACPIWKQLDSRG